jgi:hypothetical protein
MAELDTAMRQWLSDTLNVPLAASGSGASQPAAEPEPDNSFSARWTKALERWQSAIETVDGQIATLQSALRSHENPALKAIGDSGLNALTGNHKVPLMAALMDVTRAAGTPGQAAACAKAEKLALAFALHITSDPRIAAADTNPLGVAVAISATLAPALAQLETTLADGQNS